MIFIPFLKKTQEGVFLYISFNENCILLKIFEKSNRMYRYLIILILSLTAKGFAQEQLKAKLLGNWVKDEISMGDGSKIYNPEYQNLQLQLRFFETDTLRSTLNGKTSFEKYKLKDSILSYADSRFKILEVSDVKLVLKQASLQEEIQEIKVTFIKDKLYNLGFEPTHYKAKNNETVYLANEKHLYPFFVSDKSAAEYIFSKFAFPEWKKGKFTIRFIISAQNIITGIRVEESSHEKYNTQLINAIKKTRGMWRAAEWEGKPVTTEVIIDFNLDFPTYNEEDPMVKFYRSLDLTEDGKYLMNEKLYKLAIERFTEAIKLNHQNVEAYYKRAAAYILSRQPQKACEDYQQLVFLEQVQAKELYEKYCQKK